MTTHAQLEMKDARLFEDFRLAGETPDRVREVRTVLSAYDSVLCRDFTYVSTPITSGAILYRAMDAAGVRSPDELRADKSFFYDNVIRPNIEAADAVAQSMLDFGGAVISPAVFEAKSLAWSQDAYMGMWLSAIEAKATRIAMVEGWQYSNGGAEEYLQALLMQAGRRDRSNIAIVDHLGQPLTHDRVLHLLADALRDIVGRGFRSEALARVLHRAVRVHCMVGEEQAYGQCTDTAFETKRFDYQWFGCSVPDDVMRDAIRSVRDIADETLSWLSAEEIGNRSSAAMMPSLVRSEERVELLEHPAAVIAPPVED